ncbi:MAG TPA: hypothetical protein VGK01_18395 [Candidatus Angelobacter sp.]|jgi:hypothetical protein
MNLAVKRWLAFGAGAFLTAGAGILVLIFVHARTPDLTRHTYFLIAFSLGISATAILFGAMETYAKYIGDGALRGLVLRGAAVVFFAVLYAAYLFAPPDSWLDLDVYLRTDNNSLLREGGVLLHNDRGCNQPATINHEAKRAVFKHLAPSCGGQITIDTDVDGYEPVTHDYIISGANGSLTILMKPVIPSCVLFGQLIYDKNQHKPVSGARISAPSGDRPTLSNDFGQFSIPLHLKCGQETSLTIITSDGRSFNKARVPISGKEGTAEPVVLTE